MFNVEQTLWDERVGMLKFSSYGKREDPMFTSHRERAGDPHIVALVELDMQKMRMHIVLSREAIRERLQQLECHLGTTTETSGRVASIEELRNCE